MKNVNISNGRGRSRSVVSRVALGVASAALVASVGFVGVSPVFAEPVPTLPSVAFPSQTQVTPDGLKDGNYVFTVSQEFSTGWLNPKVDPSDEDKNLVNFPVLELPKGAYDVQVQVNSRYLAHAPLGTTWESDWSLQKLERAYTTYGSTAAEHKKALPDDWATKSDADKRSWLLKQFFPTGKTDLTGVYADGSTIWSLIEKLDGEKGTPTHLVAADPEVTAKLKQPVAKNLKAWAGLAGDKKRAGLVPVQTDELSAELLKDYNTAEYDQFFFVDPAAAVDAGADDVTFPAVATNAKVTFKVKTKESTNVAARLSFNHSARTRRGVLFDVDDAAKPNDPLLKFDESSGLAWNPQCRLSATTTEGSESPVPVRFYDWKAPADRVGKPASEWELVGEAEDGCTMAGAKLDVTKAALKLSQDSPLSPKLPGKKEEKPKGLTPNTPAGTVPTVPGTAPASPAPHSDPNKPPAGTRIPGLDKTNPQNANSLPKTGSMSAVAAWLAMLATGLGGFAVSMARLHPVRGRH